MKKLVFILVLYLSLFVGKVVAQCAVNVGSNQTICQGTPTAGLGGSLSGGSTTALWTDGVVSGVFSNPNDLNSTWTPPGGYSGTAILTLTATNGGPCAGTFATVQIIVTPSALASVSIAADVNPVCSGTSVTFKATAANGGATPSYQWKVNGINAGTNNSVYTSTPANNDAITCLMTSNAMCVTGSPATSNSVTMTVNSNLPAGVSIAAASNPVCAGTPVTFTATPANGGATPSYQWKVNGINAGTNSSVYTYTPANNDAITCVMTSNATCVTGNPATSSGISMTVRPVLTAAISGGTTPVCYNTSPGTLTASGRGGTGLYAYLWYKDGTSTGVSTQNYNPGSLSTTASFYCSVTSGVCGTVSTSAKTIVVYANLTAVISGGTSPICSGSSPGTLTANGVGGTGSYTYLWYKDLISTGITTQTYNPGPLTAPSSFYCVVSSGTCGSVNTGATSVVVTPQPFANIVYTGSPWCNTTGTHTVTQSGTQGGTYSATPAGLLINSSTGTITTGTSASGTYTVTYTVPASGGCGPANASDIVTILPAPLAPVIGPVTQTNCSLATGSVALSGLPSSGIWIVTRNPGGVTTSGTGTGTTITGIPAGTYTFTVANSAGCISPASTGIVINTQPSSPAAPVQNIDCSFGYGNGIVTVTSPIGTGLQYSLDGGAYQSAAIFNLVSNGGHFLSVRNAAGCTTAGSIFTVTCGCVNPPNVMLSSNTGTTCSTTPLTVSGNTFGGSATNVTLTENGGGTLNQISATTSPFAFTYTPVADDAGKTITITVTTNNPVGGICTPGFATYALTVNAMPDAPAVGTITNLTCTVPSGGVVLNGLPSAGIWTIIRNPGGINSGGSGTSTTVTGLAAGTYTFIVTSSVGCTSASTANVVINPQPSAPSAPVVGNITHPTCATSTGSVVLSGLPASGSWTLTRSPGGVTISGTGSSATVSPLPSGTHTFTVTNSVGCTSAASGNVVINPQPPIPPSPTVGTITPPTCILSTGGVLFSGLPSAGTWTLVRYPGTVITTGTGTNISITGLSTGTYNYTVTTADGCLSVPSANVVIPVQPATPAAPAIGIITQPTLSVPSGSVVLNGLPTTGTWTLIRLPGSVTITGTGISGTITNLAGGAYIFKVTNSSGCASAESATVIISIPGIPALLITDPPAVCSPSTADITDAGITAGSSPGLTYTYWKDAEATISYTSPKTAAAGTYYIKGTTVSGYFNIKPVKVTIDQLPVANAGEDQILDYQFSTTLDGSLATNQTGLWSLISGTGGLYDTADPKTSVSGLSSGTNIFLWTVKSGVCPLVSDSVRIIVMNLVIPTLITPNMDGRNDYFVIKGLTTLGKTELVIFDRRGAEVYKNMNYDNEWNGVDFNNKPLPDDTYFYVIKAQNHKALRGYIVIRR
jgi:gliding motility-associated-like protein